MAPASAAAAGDDDDVAVPAPSLSSPTTSSNIDGKRVRESKNHSDDDGDAKKNSAKKMMKKDKKSNNNNNKKKEVKAENTTLTSKSTSKVTATCVFPMRRVRRLVRGDESGNTTPDSRATLDAVFLINKASEIFLQVFAEDAFGNAVRDRRRSIGYHHLSSIVSRGKRYEFLSDFVPEQVKAEDALKAMALVET